MGNSPFFGVLLCKRRKFLSPVIGAYLAFVTHEVGESTAEASRACTALNDRTARKDVQVLEYKPGVFRKDDLGLPLDSPRVSGKGRPQQVIYLSFGSNDPLAVLAFHKLCVFDLPKMCPLRHPRSHFYEEIVPFFRVPDKYQISRLYHLFQRSFYSFGYVLRREFHLRHHLIAGA